MGRRRARPEAAKNLSERRSRTGSGRGLSSGAAASSSASGRSSRRRQSSATASSGSSRARSQNRVDRIRLGEGRDRVVDLTTDPQQLAAGDEQLQLRAALEQQPEIGRGVHDLLEVVQQEQQLALADLLGEPVLRAERLGDRLGRPGRRRAVPPGRSRTRRPEVGHGCRDSTASRVLPVPPGPERVTRRLPLRQAQELAPLSALPMMGTRGRRRFVFEIVFSGGKRPSPSWKSARLAKSFNGARRGP